MAALRNGILTVIIPKENEKDLEEIDQTVRKALHFISVETVDAVFAAALASVDCASAVDHLTAMASAPVERQEAQHGNQL